MPVPFFSDEHESCRVRVRCDACVLARLSAFGVDLSWYTRYTWRSQGVSEGGDMISAANQLQGGTLTTKGSGMADEQPVKCMVCIDALELLHMHRTEDGVVSKAAAREARAHFRTHKG